MTSVENDFNLKKRIEAIMQDSYIEKCIGKAKLPANIIEMLEILFSNSSLEETKKERLGIASVLLQLGLEMHTQVSAKDRPERAGKTRQQFVLAGDYFSSLFYRFLVQHQDFQLIEYFCQKILLINEAKLSLHVRSLEQQEYDDEMLVNHRKVTSGLVIAVADYFQHQDDFIFLWKKTVSLCLLLNDLEKSGKWMNFPPSLRQKLYQEWSELTQEMGQQGEKSKQQLRSLLRQTEGFVNKFAVKES